VELTQVPPTLTHTNTDTNIHTYQYFGTLDLNSLVSLSVSVPWPCIRGIGLGGGAESSGHWQDTPGATIRYSLEDKRASALHASETLALLD
jgi:hypothetical protein